MCDEFARLEVEKQMNNQVVHEKIVYDCMDYPATKNREGDATPYIDRVTSSNFHQMRIQ